MQVAKIKAYLASYPEWLTSEASLALRPLWETQQNWQENFDLTASDLRTSYKKALHNDTNRRHYRREGFDPKAAMLEILEWEPAHVRTVFEDLFDEKRDLEGRVQRFELYCAELFDQYRRAKPKTKLPDHFHGKDYEMASLYLSGQYPEIYAPYSTDLLTTGLQKLGARQVPEVADFPRYVKLLATLRRFLAEDTAVEEAFASFLRPQDYQGASALAVWHFLKFVQGNKASNA